MRITRDFVIKELSKRVNISHIQIANKSSVSIICPFHLDKDPSLSVSLGGKVSPGVFYCFSCGAKGHWNVLASKLGLTTVNFREGDDLTDYEPVVAQKIELFSPIQEEELELRPLDLTWRDNPKWLMDALEVRKMWSLKLQDWYLYMPVTYIYEYYGHIRAKIHKESIGLKYWFNLRKKVFYPFDYYLDKDSRTIVLVEGVADVYRLMRNRIPALSVLGTMFNPETGLDCLEILNVKTVIFCYDGDEAGHDAIFGDGDHVGKAMELEREGYDVRIIEPPMGCDPDDMPQYYVDCIRKMVVNTGGSLL